MAKPGNKPITADDLKKYVEEQSDFGFELKILKLLRDAGIECEHSALYNDPVTGKSREFDIRAKVVQGVMQVVLAVECKNVRPNFPLLVLRTPRTSKEAHNDLLMSLIHDRNKDYADPRMRPKARAFRLALGESYYKPNFPVGRSFSQVGLPAGNDQTSFVAADDGVFDKWSQCLASASELLLDCYKQSHPQNTFSAIRGVLVVPDDMLWVCDYNNSGVMQTPPVRVQECSYFVGKEYVVQEFIPVKYSISHIDIMTQTGFAEFIANYLGHSSNMDSLFPKAPVNAEISKGRND